MKKQRDSYRDNGTNGLKIAMPTIQKTVKGKSPCVQNFVLKNKTLHLKKGWGARALVLIKLLVFVFIVFKGKSPLFLPFPSKEIKLSFSTYKFLKAYECLLKTTDNHTVKGRLLLETFARGPREIVLSPAV